MMISHPRRRLRAFTLIELLVVISIIMALLALGIPAVSAIRASQREQTTVALVDMLVSAFDQYRHQSIMVPAAGGGDGPTRLLWDFNGDQILDGDPRKDDAFAVDDLRPQAERAGYRGPVIMLQLAVSPSQVDAQGRLVDAWRQPLRVAIFPPKSGRLRPWSTGPDRQADVGADGDDLKPWSSHRER